MSPDTVTFQSQIAHWTWTIAWFFWFIGLGGMLSVAYYKVRRPAVAFAILVCVTLGLITVFTHLSRWWNMPIVVWTMVTNLHFNYHSWMFLGVCVLSVHLVMAAFFAASHVDWLFQRFPFLGFIRTLAGLDLVCFVFGFVGVFSVVYSGFLLTQAVGIPLWGTSLIPILWVISGGVAAVAALELMALAGWVDEGVSAFGLKLGLGLDALKLLAVASFLHVSAGAVSAAARLGAEELLFGSLAWMTWGMVIGIGILIPMVLAAWMVWFGKRKVLIGVSAVAALTGVLFLRASILLAGAWEPLIG